MSYIITVKSINNNEDHESDLITAMLFLSFQNGDSEWKRTANRQNYEDFVWGTYSIKTKKKSKVKDRFSV